VTPIFVVQQHRARTLHWDFRLERNGVLVSWAVPKGLPPDPRENRLAVHVEDHDLAHATYEDPTPAGPAGLPTVLIWDSGSYDTQTWDEREVKVVLHGRRVQGRYALIATKEPDWIIHRMDGPVRPGWQPPPVQVRPMLAVPGPMPPATDGSWAYEPAVDGGRAVAYVNGGRLRLRSAAGADVTAVHPQVRGLGEALGAVPAVLDGVLGEVYYVIDVLYLDGVSTLDLSYRHRRRLLEGLHLAGPAWRTVVSTADAPRGDVLAKRLDSPYRAGERSPDWRLVRRRRPPIDHAGARRRR
jgi:bifunctional non-homologous end joining protein LigD